MADSNYWSGSRAQTVTRRGMLRATLLGSAGIAAAALIGCSSGRQTNNGSTAGSAVTRATIEGPAPLNGAKAKVGGRLTNTFGAIPSFDFHQEVTANVNRVLDATFNQLVQFDPFISVQSPKTVRPDLARSWEIAPDGQTYTFHLAQNVRFHDGTSFSAADVKASFQRQLTPPKGKVMPRGSQIRTIKSMETPDANTLVMKLSRPVSPDSLMSVLAQPYLAIYSQKDIDANFDFETKINGTGPFRLASADMTTKISLDKNKDYFVANRPYLDGYDLYNIADASTLLAQIQSGAINIAGVNVTNLPSLQKSLGDKAVFQTTPLQTVLALNMNSKRPPFNDERVRRAVALAYDKGAAIKVILAGDGVIGGYMFPSGVWALSQAELEQIDGYKPYSEAGLADANKLIAAAGANGAAFQLLAATGQDNQNLFLKDQVAKIGLKATLNIVDYAKQYDALNSRNFDAFNISLAFFVDDPDSVYPDHFLTDSPINYSGLGSKAVDDLWLKQSTELNPQMRAQMVKDLEKLALPLLGKLIYYYTISHTVIQKAKDFVWADHNQTNERMENVWLDA